MRLEISSRMKNLLKLLIIIAVLEVNLYSKTIEYAQLENKINLMNFKDQKIKGFIDTFIINKLKEGKIQINENYFLNDNISSLILLIPMTHYDPDIEFNTTPKNDILNLQKEIYFYLQAAVKEIGKLHILFEGMLNKKTSTEQINIDQLVELVKNETLNTTPIELETLSGVVTENKRTLEELMNGYLLEGTASMLLNSINSFYDLGVTNGSFVIKKVSDDDRVLIYGAETNSYKSDLIKNTIDTNQRITIRNMYTARLIEALASSSDSKIIIYQVGRTHLLNKETPFKDSISLPSLLKEKELSFLIICPYFKDGYCTDEKTKVPNIVSSTLIENTELEMEKLKKDKSKFNY